MNNSVFLKKYAKYSYFVFCIVHSDIFVSLIILNIFYFFNVVAYLFLAALGLRYCTRAFSSCGEWGLLFVAVCGLLIEVASLVVKHRL